MTDTPEALRELLARSRSIADELDEASLERATILELCAALAQRQQVPADESAWWALAMGAAASLEDAALCMRDADAEKAARGAAAHVRRQCAALTAAPSAQAAIEPLLFRDLALELGVSVATLTQTIARRGLGNFSVNMAVPVTVAKAVRDPAFGLVRDAAPSAQAEPVAWGIFDSQGFYEAALDEASARRFCEHYNKRTTDPLKPYRAAPLYAAPPTAQAEPQVPLTAEGIDIAFAEADARELTASERESIARAIERAHGIGKQEGK